MVKLYYRREERFKHISNYMVWELLCYI